MKKSAKRVISVILVLVILALQVNAGVLAFDASNLYTDNVVGNMDDPAVYSQKRTEIDGSVGRLSASLTPIPGSGCVVDDANGFIYGLAPAIDSLEGYVNVAPGYELSFIQTDNGFGTGTLANVVAEGIIVESYTIIIFGDVNGDGNIDNVDAALAVDYENFKISWDPIIDAAYIKAADINGDGNIDGLDAGIAIDVENYIARINQTGGLPYTSGITFNSAGGTPVSVLFGDSGDIVIPPAEPVKTGYTFIGWLPTLPAEFPIGFLAVTAQWTVKQCSITFDSAGGTCVADITQDYDTQVSAPLTPTKTGSTFDGWYSDAGLTMAVSWPYTLSEVDVTFYAKWKANSYNITFDANSGMGGWGPTSMAYGTTLAAPTVTREGYTFSSWSPSVPGTVPAGDIVFTAQWTINKYKISFDSVGGTAVADITQDYGTSITAPDAPTKTGYTFTGWEPSVPQAIPAENVECVAQWTINQYTVSFDSNGGTTFTDIIQNYNTQVTAPLAPTKTGHTFDGWYTNAGLTTAVSWPHTLGASNVTFYAKWTVNNYNITFDANGGTGGTGPTSMEYGAVLTAPTVTREGYTFSSWSPSVPGTVSAENAVYTAQWSINAYKISFDSAGGTTVTDITQVYGTSVTVPNSPTKTGYTFDGWVPSVPQAMPAENVHCIAQWTINQYTVNFNSNGGTAVTDITQSYNTQVLVPPAPTKTGHTFGGWYSDAELTIPVSWPYTLGAASVTFYAKWTVNSYNITFNANGGTGGWGPTSMAYGTTLTVPTVIKEGYTFSSWSPIPPSAVTVGGGTYTAQWTANTYAVIYSGNGNTEGTVPSNSFHTYDSVTNSIRTNSGNLAKIGYAFGGWNTNADGTGTDYAMGATNVGNLSTGGNVTLYAKWSINQYTISFDSAGGSSVTSINQDYGTVVTPPANPTKDGYTFTGWVPSVPQAMPSKNVECVAQWSTNAYTVYFNSNGGSAVAGVTQNYNTQVSVPLAPTKTGHTFDGWYSNAGMTTSVSWPYTLGASDITFFAKWILNNYNITFAANGGTGGTGPTSMAYGATLTAPTVTREGYAFSGWSPSVPGTVPAKDTVYTAQWGINEYKISFNSAGGTAVMDITQDYGTAITAPDDPTKMGYTFVGWQPTVPATMPAEELTCVAIWNINYYPITFDANGGIGGQTPMVAFGVKPTAPGVTKLGYAFDGWLPNIANVTGATTYTAQWVPYIYGTGDVVEFGSYPQSEVSDPALVAVLNAATLNVDNTVDYDGFKYKREYFTEYIAEGGGTTDDPYSSRQDDNGYFVDTVYWFKFEPIKWRVLSSIDGEILVVADKILTSKEYFDQQDTDVTWETSGLRDWLNDDFLNTAFDSGLQAKIVTSIIDNPDNPESLTIGGNSTNDKLFLLAHFEATEPSYGFNSDYNNSDASREAAGTDFAKCSGLYVIDSGDYEGNSFWWLRSPGDYQDYAGYIDTDGSGARSNPTVLTYFGVRPALRINVTP